jgi:hypothetical protein
MWIGELNLRGGEISADCTAPKVSGVKLHRLRFKVSLGLWGEESLAARKDVFISPAWTGLGSNLRNLRMFSSPPLAVLRFGRNRRGKSGRV